MQIQLIAVGNRMPAWVSAGYQEYAKRMPRECELVLTEVAPGKRLKSSDVSRIVQDEGQRMLASAYKGSFLVALDIPGKAWSTEQLADNLQQWLQQGQSIALLIGGPEGLSADVKQAARTAWSLSPLTLPHPLVRIIVAEQLYRAWSLIHNHPYHR